MGTMPGANGACLSSNYSNMLAMKSSVTLTSIYNLDVSHHLTVFANFSPAVDVKH